MSVAVRAEPAFLWVPEHATSSAGREVADLAKSLGFDVDGPEEAALHVLMAEADGKWAGLEAAVICGRQNLKTWALEMTVLYDAFLRDVKRVVWTSHRFKTTQQAFEDLNGLIAATDWLSRRVKKVRTANGEEGFELTSGARIDFLARTSGGGRGLTGDTVVLDEALFLQPMMMGALLPTLSSRPDPHVRYGSSPGIRESAVLRSIRDRGRAGNDPSLAYIEFTSQREPCADPLCRHGLAEAGCQLDNEEKWQQANPALGRRISLDYVRQERRALAAEPVEFMRERLGWWEDPPTEDDQQVIDSQLWADRLDDSSTIADGAKLAFAIDTSWDRQTTWISVAGLREDDEPHIEVVSNGYGTDWVIPWLEERLEKYNPVAIGLQGAGAPVSSLLDQLKAKFGQLVHPLSGQDLGRACGMFFDAVSSGPLRHIGQEQLDIAIKKAVPRPIGDAWVWDRKTSPVDIAQLVAATEALYLLLTVDPPKKKRSRAIGW